MQQTLRPYATAGIALVGASMIAVTPPVAQPPDVQVRPVRLVDAWSDLLADTTANWDNIVSNANVSDISQVFSALLTNPLGVITAVTDLDPTVATDTSSLPLQISVGLTPALEYLLGQLGATGAGIEAINGVALQLQSDPSNALSILYEGTATVLNAYLNGADNVSLLGGIIDIPLFNGVLAPEQTATVDINLTDLINALGLGNLNLGSLDLSSLLSQIGLGNLDLGQLFSDLNLSNDGLGTLLEDGSGVTTLGGLLNLLGLGGLDVGTFSLTSVLSGLGLDTGVNLNNLTLDQVLSAFGLNPSADVGLGTFLTDLAGSDSGLATFLDTGLGTELFNLGLLSGPLSTLNGILGGLLTTAQLEGALNGTVADPITVGSLLDGGPNINDSLQTIITALGLGDVTPSGLTVGGLLEALGFPSSTGDLTLSQLLGDLVNTSSLDPLSLNITDLLNNVSLGTLLGDLGLNDVPLNLSSLGDLSGLTLDDLLGDLGLGNLADVSVSPLGGLITELVDTVPQQILAAL